MYTFLARIGFRVVFYLRVCVSARERMSVHNGVQCVGRSGEQRATLYSVNLLTIARAHNMRKTRCAYSIEDEKTKKKMKKKKNDARIPIDSRRFNLVPMNNVLSPFFTASRAARTHTHTHNYILMHAAFGSQTFFARFHIE